MHTFNLNRDMKWLNIKGLVICIIVFILLDSTLYNIGIYGNIETITQMNEDFETPNPFSSVDAFIAGSTIIAFLISLLIYLTVFLKKKQ